MTTQKKQTKGKEAIEGSSLLPEDYSCISMTGFARASQESDTHVITCEIRAVNSRYLDTVVRIGRELSALEPQMRKKIGEFCDRGRVEVVLSVELRSEVAPSVGCSSERFQSYFSASEKLLTKNDLWTESVREQLAVDILIRREIFEEERADLAADQEPYINVLEVALTLLRQAQRTEGITLSKDLIDRRSKIIEFLSKISEIHDAQRASYEESLREKLSEYLTSEALPEERLVAEVAILVEKTDIAEEVTRLDSHLNQFLVIMKKTPSGRKLDFLLQECVREVNTIASKIQNSDAQHLVVEVKAELERMKEQVQNIE